MHTFLKRKHHSDDEEPQYHIGMWLPGLTGVVSFQTMFTVGSFKEAVTMVSLLNGGKNLQLLDVIAVTEID